MMNKTQKTIMVGKPRGNIKIDDNVRLYEHPAWFTFEDYKKLTDSEKKKMLVDEGRNLIVDAGLNLIGSILANTNAGAYIQYCAVGSNGTAVLNTDTALNTQIDPRVSISNLYSGSTGIFHFDTFFTTTSNNGTWLEAGLFDSSGGGNMLCRKVLSSFVKSSSNTATLAWTITWVAV